MGYKLKESIRLSEIASRLSLSWAGTDVLIDGVSQLSDVSANELTFAKEVAACVVDGSVVVVGSLDDDIELKKQGVFLSENPRLSFIKILDFMVREIGFSSWDFPAFVDPSVVVGKNVVIEDGCYIGKNTVIEHNVVLHSGTRIGENCRIRSCSSIGGDGFGFERLEGSESLRFPHLGGVLIGDNVEIGSCTTICRGTLSDTVIENHVKVDNLVHIAHNCTVKQGAYVIACAEISGGVEIGCNAWIAPNSCTHQKVVIGDESIIGLGAVVTKNIPSNSVYAGNPARKIRDNIVSK